MCGYHEIIIPWRDCRYLAVPHNTPCVCLSHDNPTLFCILLPNYPLLMQNTNFFVWNNMCKNALLTITGGHWQIMLSLLRTLFQPEIYIKNQLWIFFLNQFKFFKATSTKILEAGQGNISRNSMYILICALYSFT